MSARDYIQAVPELPGKPTALWLDTTESAGLPAFSGEAEADVVIVGGGLVGMLTAFLLASSNQSVILLEAGEIGGDVTGHTTAKITSQHGLIYTDLKKKFGEETARLYGQSNEAGLKLLDSIVHSYNLRCDYKKTDAFLFTREYKDRGKLIQEVNLCEKLGLPADFTGSLELPFESVGAEIFHEQAQFHPRKFIMELLPKIIEAGGKVFENSRVTSCEDGDICEVRTEKGHIIAKKMIIATHYPVYDTGKFYTKLYPYRSYVLAGEIEEAVPEGLYYEYFPGNQVFSFRSQKIGLDNLMIFGAGNHYAGRAKNHIEEYKAVNRAVKEHNYNFKAVRYHWSTQDNYTPDLMPYIGLSPKTKNTYLATGFAGWGMSLSAVSGLILSNLILGKEDGAAKIYQPNRFGLAALPTFLRTNISSALHILSDRFKKEKASFDFIADIPEEAGRLVETKKGKIAVYKEKDGSLKAKSSKCTHMGCQVHWNEAEKTWDCHCHGSRFGPNGEVIHGPAKKELDNEDLKFE